MQEIAIRLERFLKIEKTQNLKFIGLKNGCFFFNQRIRLFEVKKTIMQVTPLEKQVFMKEYTDPKSPTEK